MASSPAAKMPGNDRNPIRMNTKPTGETGGTELEDTGVADEPGYDMQNSLAGTAETDLEAGYTAMGKFDAHNPGDKDGMKRPPSADQGDTVG